MPFYDTPCPVAYNIEFIKKLGLFKPLILVQVMKPFFDMFFKVPEVAFLRVLSI